MSFNNVPELLESIRQGRMVVLLDDEARENEGDLVMAATHVTPAAINFMVTHARGLVCLTLTPLRCQQLQLPLMVTNNQAGFQTNFTVSIEAAKGVTTGISVYDRARTIQTAVAPNAVAEDLVQPGHIFPIQARAGGVLERPGHTEAGCDLARLAGLEPAAVIVEILNPDGTMSRRPELHQFARQHGLKIGSIADLIAYRQQTEIRISDAS
jgi:3,4-dihydroxy 2-butanone 4-phosphate synthase / GTP cyclohydrolase II